MTHNNMVFDFFDNHNYILDLGINFFDKKIIY
jgi:hypothetical protein